MTDITTRLPLRIGTRASRLALAQTHHVVARLRAAHSCLLPPEALEVVEIRTTGDQVQDRALAEIGGKGLFTKEIDEALLDGRVDLAVHSMKDVPTHLPDNTVVAAVLDREDVRDVLLDLQGRTLADLPPGAVVGTASLRRQAQVLAARPDLRVVPFRGNVQTRLRKLAEGDVDATLLAYAGLRRLGMAEEPAISALLDTETMLPAVAQGAVGVACREDDLTVRVLLRALDDATTHTAVLAERALLRELEGNCRTPIAALATVRGAAGQETVHLRGLLATEDGHQIWRNERSGTAAGATALGQAAGAALRDQRQAAGG